MPITFNKPLVLGKKAVFNPGGFIITGSPEISSEGILSDISIGNYVLCNYIRGNTFEFNAKFNCTDFSANGSKNTIYCINANFSYLLRLEGNQLVLRTPDNWGSPAKGSKVFEENKDYWIRAAFDGSTYTAAVSEDGINWTEDINFVTSSLGSPAYLALGINPYTGSENPFNGTIDLKTVKLYSNGSLVLSGSKLITPEWQAKPFKFDVTSIN